MNVLCLGGGGKICREAALDLGQFPLVDTTFGNTPIIGSVTIKGA